MVQFESKSKCITYTIIALVFLVFGTVVGGFLLYPMFFLSSSHTRDSFWELMWMGTEESVNTELIPCDANSNVYTRIDIHRNYNIPRFGIITNCDGQILDTVWYVPSSYSYKPSMTITDEMDTSITVEWKEPFAVVMMDALTGRAILGNNEEQPILFTNFGGVNIDTSTISVSNGVPRATKDKDKNEVTIYYGSNLPDGLYFLLIVNVNNNSIPFSQTIRKGHIATYTELISY